MLSSFTLVIAVFSTLVAIALFLALQKEKKVGLSLELEIKEKEKEVTDLTVEIAKFETEISFLKNAQGKLGDSFKALSLDVLETSNKTFLDLAKQTLEKYQESAKQDLEKRQKSIENVVNPVKETLNKLDKGMGEIEKERRVESSLLKEQMKSLLNSEKELKNETASLVKALRKPHVRGQWGELQLKRVVELAGMINHCDFYLQESVTGDETNAGMRPDLIVRLPGDKQIIVDAKTPLDAFLDAINTDNEAEKELHLERHAKQLRKHVKDLGKKSYFQHFSKTPEFVVLFIPSETFFSAALEKDPSIIELGVEQGVIMATPMTLIGLLRAVAYGWKQESLSKHAETISKLGAELYKRVIDMGTHFSKIGKSLGSAVESYNKTIGTLESRVLVSARKFKSFGIASDKLEIDAIDPIDKIPRQMQSEELLVEEKI